MLLQQGRISEGIDVLERLAADPDTGPEALAALVTSYVRDGNTAQAVTLLDRLIAENPGNIRAQILRTELHLQAGEMAQAEERLRGAVGEAPESPLGYTALARFYLQTARSDEAEQVVRAGIEAVESDESLSLLLAEMLERRQAFDEAIETYRDLHRRFPDSVLVANNYASLLAEYREDDPAAVAEAARVARRLRGSTVPYFMDTYGWTLFLSGSAEEGRRVLIEAAEALPANPLVRYHLGRAHAHAGDGARARTELEAALAIDPNFPKATSARAALAALEAGGG
jgi:predicted Zn-dependent protease